MAAETPQQFASDLVLLDRRAMGGMAEVFRAVQTGAGRFQRTVAVKRILPHFAADESFKRMFQYEVSLCARFTHPNIVQVYRAGEADGYLYLVMEFVRGKNLSQLQRAVADRTLEIPIEIACYIAAEAAKGLDHAHGCTDDRGQPLNVVHRDVSPQNIMITYDGHVKVVDFGIARAADRSELTASGGTRGKIAYMSPEQALGESIDRRADVFALGVVFHELLTRRRLFVGEGAAAIARRVVTGTIPPPSHVNTGIDPELDAIVARALARTVGERYPSAGELLHDVTIYLNEHYPRFVPAEQMARFMREIFATEIADEERREREIRHTEVSEPTTVQSIDLSDTQADPAPEKTKRSEPSAAPAPSSPIPPPVRTPLASLRAPADTVATPSRAPAPSPFAPATTPTSPVSQARVLRRPRTARWLPLGVGAAAVIVGLVAAQRFFATERPRTVPLADDGVTAPSAPESQLLSRAPAVAALLARVDELRTPSRRLTLRVELGFSLAQQGLRGAAEEVLGAAARELPDLTASDDRDRLWTRLAAAYALLGSAERATEMARRVGSVSLRSDALAAVAPDLAAAREIKVPASRDQALVRLLDQEIKNGRLGTIEALAEEITDPSARSALLGRLARAMLKAGRRKDVTDWARHLDGMSRAEVQSALAVDAIERGDRRQAETWVKAIEPEIVRARTLATQAGLLGSGRSAETLSARALELATGLHHPSLRSAAIDEVILALVPRNPLRALALLEQAGGVESEARLKSAIAAAMATRGDLSRAETLIASIEETPAWSTAALDALSRAYVARGELTRALETVKRVRFIDHRLPVLAAVAAGFSKPPSHAERETLVSALKEDP